LPGRGCDTVETIMVQTPMGAAMMVPVRRREQNATPVNRPAPPASAVVIQIAVSTDAPRQALQQGGMLMPGDAVAAAAPTR